VGFYLRHLAGTAADLFRFGRRTGRWWFPVVLVALGAGALMAATLKVVVPTAVYVLF